MSATTEAPAVQALNFRRFKDGDSKVKSLQKDIFDAGHSHKCPDLHSEHAPLPGQLPGR
jgi:hypothetical protein